MKDFFGRDELIESMKSLWNKRVPSLITCRGRRRVGKSTLIAEFARRTGARLIKLEGLRPVEVKRRNELGHEVVDEIEEKVARIRRPRGVSMKTALVYDGHLAKTVEADGYFDAVIDIRDVMF